MAEQQNHGQAGQHEGAQIWTNILDCQGGQQPSQVSKERQMVP